MQLQQVRGGGCGDHADAQAGEDPGGEQAGQSGAGEEDDRGDDLQGQGGQQDPSKRSWRKPPPIPISAPTIIDARNHLSM
ncbi:MAG: hypothetical protein ABW022_00480 [Actinoplanes sp.]